MVNHELLLLPPRIGTTLQHYAMVDFFFAGLPFSALDVVNGNGDDDTVDYSDDDNHQLMSLRFRPNPSI